MIHLYYGNGKGKTTAACGLALRAAGSGLRVLFIQFFKAGDSGEMQAFARLSNVDLLVPALHYGRYKMLNEAQKTELSVCYGRMLDDVVRRAQAYDLIVLDEAVSVYKYGLFDRQTLVDLLRREGKRREIILTGRDPAPELSALADYATEMKKSKHPFDSGLVARKGIEY